jgi:hypothetical protein
MKRRVLLVTLTWLLAALLPGCRDKSTGPDLAVVEVEDEAIFIVDRTGKKWDVTHAKEKYGMKPSLFQFGLGPNAIKPILEPRMLQPGGYGYPDDMQDFAVLGVELNGSERAYSILILAHHEVAEEQFGDAHVAVAY